MVDTKTQALQDAWRKYVAEGRNVRTESRKQIETFVKRLVREGQLRSDQVQGAIDEIQNRSEKYVEEVTKRVRSVIGDELQRLGVAKKSDITRLERKIARVEKQVSDVKKPAARGTAAKSTTSKKTAASKARSTASKKAPARRSRSTK